MDEKDKSFHKVLLDREALLQRVSDSAPVMIWSVDREGIIRLSEGRALETIGVKNHELVGQSVYELYQHRPDVLDYIDRAMAGESVMAEIAIGDLFLESYYTPVRDEKNEIQGVMGITIDVTSHTKTTEALRISEERTAHAQRAGKVGIWEWDLQTNEVYWSDNIEAMFGLEPGQFAGNYDAYLEYVHPEDRQNVTQAIEAALTGNTDFKVEQRIIWPDDSVHWLYAIGEVSCDDQGQPVRVTGSVQDITQRIEAEQELRQSEQDLEKSQQLAHVGTWNWDMDNNTLRWSRELYRIYGQDPDTFNQNLWEYSWQTIHPDDKELIDNAIEESRQHPGQDIQREYRFIRPDGSVRKAWAVGTAISDANGKFTKTIGIIQDITEKSRAAEVMRKLSRALEQTDDLVLITDREGFVEFVNTAFENVTGYKRDEIIGKKPNLLRSGEHESVFYKHMWETILRGDSFKDVVVNRRKDGSTFYEQKTITPLVDQNGDITHFISTGKDITQSIQDQKRVQFLAHHDVLTELPNRALFAERLDHALLRRHEQAIQIALIFIDLDRFKIINDTLGHDAGDRFLQSISERLLGCLREEDTVARLGGDEFAILLEDIESIDQVAGVARKIINSLSMPFILDKQELYVTASLGISIYPSDGSDSRTLLKNADIAMYRAKDMGRNSYQFYSADMGTKALERMTLETSLRHALVRGEFLIHYQPQIDLKQQRIVAVEALLRWQHPDLGLVSPIEFISILEETGLIVDVGEWVMKQACRQVREWNRTLAHPIQLSVNVSTRQFSSSRFGKTVQTVLADTALDAELLILEITESLILHSSNIINTNFKTLLDMNVNLALDDFGTGYSSLSYLKRFPISALKIDRTFVRDIVTEPEDASIVEAIIALSRSLDLQVVAEGVETPEQQKFLDDRDCDIAQGFLFSPPLVAQEIPEVFSKEMLF